jgi:hypothetical protein
MNNYLLLLSLALALGCQPKVQNNSWVKTLPGHGTNSSPRLADLTGDGILDVVIGAGKNEWEPSDTAVVALDGANGNLLWTVAAPNQVTGTATFLDVTGDGVPDVFIGGRSAFMAGIDGKTGQSSSSLAAGYFNDDNVPDFFGHFAIGVWPDNYGARQVAVDGRNGRILKEYRLGCTGFFSPVALDFDDDGTDEVLLSVNQYNCTGIHVVDC